MILDLQRNYQQMIVSSRNWKSVCAFMIYNVVMIKTILQTSQNNVCKVSTISYRRLNTSGLK